MGLWSRRVELAVKRQVITAIIVLLAWTLPAAAQNLLPTTAGGWTAAGAALQVAPAQLQQVAGGRADVIREYGLTSAEQRQYAQSQQTVSITLYRMVDPSAAYGVFTVLRNPQMQPADLGDSVSYAAASADQALFVVGNLVVATSPAAQRPQDGALIEIGASLLPRADARPYPSIGAFLPSSSVVAGSQRYRLGPDSAAVSLPARVAMVPGSERYVLGMRSLREVLPWVPETNDDWMGFEKSAEAIVARYRGNPQASAREMTLLITMYPTQQIAADQFANLGKFMAFNVEEEQAGERPVVYGSRSSVLVALVFGAASRTAANELLSQIRYHSSITWNEPSHSFNDPSFPTMIIGVFEGTGLIMLFALAAGIGFGGVRLLVKFVLPGKVFDRAAQIEILQLGLSSKPIDSRDFY
jgi:hypothetical protein